MLMNISNIFLCVFLQKKKKKRTALRHLTTILPQCAAGAGRDLLSLSEATLNPCVICLFVCVRAWMNAADFMRWCGEF